MSKQIHAFNYAIDKRVKMLYDLGLEDYEVEYLLFLRRKQELGKKWKR
jgi:hypothetical protein